MRTTILFATSLLAAIPIGIHPNLGSPKNTGIEPETCLRQPLEAEANEGARARFRAILEGNHAGGIRSRTKTTHQIEGEECQRDFNDGRTRRLRVTSQQDPWRERAKKTVPERRFRQGSRERVLHSIIGRIRGDRAEKDASCVPETGIEGQN